jgi:hypothetical protein
MNDLKEFWCLLMMIHYYYLSLLLLLRHDVVDLKQVKKQLVKLLQSDCFCFDWFCFEDLTMMMLKELMTNQVKKLQKQKLLQEDNENCCLSMTLSLSLELKNNYWKEISNDLPLEVGKKVKKTSDNFF